MNRGYCCVLLALWIGPVCAVNKCVEIDGRVFYQAAPCPPGAYGGDMSLNVNRPFTGGVKQPVLPPMPLLPTDNSAEASNDPAEVIEPVKPETSDKATDKIKPTMDDTVPPPKKDKRHLDKSEPERDDQPLMDTLGDRQ